MKYVLVGMNLMAEDIEFIEIYGTFKEAISSAERQLNIKSRYEYKDLLECGDADIDFQDFKIVIQSRGKIKMIWKVFAIEFIGSQNKENHECIDLNHYEQILRNVITMVTIKEGASSKEVLEKIGYTRQDLFRFGSDQLAKHNNKQ